MSYRLNMALLLQKMLKKTLKNLTGNLSLKSCVARKFCRKSWPDDDKKSDQFNRINLTSPKLRGGK